MKKKITGLLLVFSMSALVLAGCGSSQSGSDATENAAETEAADETDVTASGDASEENSEDAAEDTEIAGETAETEEEDTELNEEIVDTIRDRGYLIAGCKTDVPGLGYYDEETDTWEGIEIELAYKVAAQIFGVDDAEAKAEELVQFQGVTVADREQTLADGDIDVMIATYTMTDERAEKFALSDSYYTDYIGLMVRDSHIEDNANSLGSSDIGSIADLDGKYIGVPDGATTRADMLEYIDTMNSLEVNPIFMEFTSYPDIFKALKDGNIDVMAVDVSILNGYVDNDTKILNDRFASQHYAAAVTKENAALLEYINAAIAE